MLRKIRLKAFVTLLMAFGVYNTQAQGLYVSSGWDLFIHSDLYLDTDPSMTWTTQRALSPGYISVGGSAKILGSTDAFNVNGYVKKVGNTSFTFPVGTGSDLRVLTIGAPANATDAFATAWILGNPTSTADPTDNGAYHPVTSVGTSSTIKRVSTVGQWDWQTIDGTAAGLSVSVSMPAMTTFSPHGHLRLVGWDSTNSRWIQLGTQIPATNTENTLLTGTMINGISAIGIGSIADGFPDFTVVPSFSSSNYASAGIARDYLINVLELAGNISGGNVRVRVNKPSSYDLSYDSTATSIVIGTTTSTLQNSGWSVTDLGTSLEFRLKDPNGIIGNESNRISIRATRKANRPVSVQNLTFTIQSTTGGDNNSANNRVTIQLSAL